MSKSSEQDLYKAIKGALVNPKLPAYMYIQNFNYLVDNGGYIDKLVKNLSNANGPNSGIKLYNLQKFDIDQKASGFDKMVEKNKEDFKNG